MSYNCFGSSTADATDNATRNLPSKPECENFFKDVGSFAYMFVDKLGERRFLPTVASIDLMKSKNGRDHNTSRFYLNRDSSNHLVIRRGQPFYIKISFNAEFNIDDTILKLCFQTSKYPLISNGTEVLIPVSSSSRFQTKGWEAILSPTKGHEILVTINTPADCIIGIWSIEIQTIRKEDVHPNMIGRPIMNRYSSHSIYILFNPWNKDDHVYMDNEVWRQEYVLNDVGKIWRGVASNFRPCTWSFGQYEKNILDASMILLDWSRLRYNSRRSPIHISRTVSAMVNANDDRGILIGNWSGEYSDGTPPTDWQGSVQILQQWYDNGGDPVCYGQCWVFSGVTTTILRALGIPARSVTNFASAHDTDSSITIDLHFNEKGKQVAEMNKDSVWNFHVWNDCWMQRPDLPRGYGGWQAIDATPQEMSNGKFRAGPASLVAIRQGEVGYQYDTAFIFAEVNADKVYWLYKSNEDPLKFIDLDQNAIGKFISTRKPGKILFGNADRDDITEQYKQTELSEEERMVVMNAVSKGGSSVRHIYQKQDVADVFCHLEVKDEIHLGDTFPVQVKVHNQSNDIRTVKTCLRVAAMQYTGVIMKRVAKNYSEEILLPDEEKLISVIVRPEDYIDKLQDQGSLMMSAMLHIKETGQTYHAEDDFRVRFPDIAILPQGPMRVGQKTRVNASFQNPLDKYLTRAKFIFEGPGVETPTIIHIPTVGKRMKAEASWEIKPPEEGEHIILVSFTSRELRDVDGSLNVVIKGD